MKELKIEIIAVGSELLTPYYQDTNSLYLTRQINDLGMSISLKTILLSGYKFTILNSPNKRPRHEYLLKDYSRR